ncbi:MAG: hypothetical protein JNM14_03340 [Ferruginibacter sp.]|nr:hypothetical protein [Ferruginibacter sp.]
MPSNSLSSFFLRYGKLCTGLLWLLSVIIYLNIYGVVTRLEAEKYIDEANLYINTGSFSAPRFWFYSATIFIIAIAIKIKTGMVGAFVIQALLNFFAFMLFYKALTKIFQSALTPVLIIFYLLAFSPYQSWVVYLYTESVFFSAILMLVSTLILYKPDRLKNILFISLALLLAFISRPLGILLGMGVYVYFFYYANKKWKVIIACGSVVMMMLGYFVINTVFSSIHDWHITQAFEEESIICDLPASQPYQKLDLVNTGSPLYQLWHYVTHNFSHFLQFAGLKIQYFFLMTRNYYSNTHNLFLLLNVIPLYVSAICSFFIRKHKFSKEITAFLAGIILFYTLTIVFQCDDYHNRFLLSIYPLFVLLAARFLEHFCLFMFKHHK